MTKCSFHPERWLIVDDSREDAENFMQAILDVDGKAEWAADLKSAEALLKKKNFDVVILDYILRSSGRTGDELLPSLRRALPHLPVVMVSSSDSPDLPLTALSAGADVFLPKTSMGLALSRQLLAAARSAAAARTLRAKQEREPGPSREHFLWPEARDTLEVTLSRKTERLLIVGPTGGGRTTLALKVAREFLAQRYNGATRPLVYLSLESMDVAALESELLGEKERLPERMQLSAFERALGGVLVLDGLEVLPIHLQSALKTMCESMDFGTRPFEDALKVVATVRVDDLTSLEPGLVEVFAHRELYIPSLSSFPEKAGLLDALCQNLGVTVSESAREKLLIALSIPSWAGSIRAARRNLGLAIARSQAAGRATIFPEDLDGIEAIVGGVEAAPGNESRNRTSDFNAIALLGLNEMVRGGQTRLEVARDVLKDVLVRSSLERFGGNKKKVAEVLGVSRQTIYEVVGR